MHEDIDRLTRQNGSIFILASRRAWGYYFNFNRNFIMDKIKTFFKRNIKRYELIILLIILVAIYLK